MLKPFKGSFFCSTVKKALAPYRRSESSFQIALDEILENPQQGDVYPGISPACRKTRIALKEYNIGKSGGLRLIYMIGKNILVFICTYYKGQYKKESDIVQLIKCGIKSATLELKGQSPSHPK